MNMIRGRSADNQNSSVYEDGEPLVRQPGRFVPTIAPLTPPDSPEKSPERSLSSPSETPRPSKIRRQGSKLVAALRTFTNSGISSASFADSILQETPTEIPATLGVRRISAALLKGQVEQPTVVHRTQFKSRPSVISLDRGVLELTPEVSPSTSATSSMNSGPVPRPGESTGKTSLDSKTSTIKSKIGSQNSSENKKTSTKGSGSNESSLAPIAEIEAVAPVPTIATVEIAAATKIFLECHYNSLTSGSLLTSRSIRRRQLERALVNEISQAEKENRRRIWAKHESDHIRETRVLKARALTALSGKEIITSRYEVVKVLGKGSFGVVRLVREKVEDPSVELKKEIYAMKVIRKSDMLRNSQEGHLRAERDFLIAAEGSRWVVPLMASFQDLNNLYLIMDYMPGGDFLGLLIRDNVLTEPVTKWYIAEMILCIEEAHALHWIHRDVKPDNFLISASGHLKISDFGLAFDGHWSHDQAYYNHHRYSLLTKLGITVDGDSIDRKEGRNIANALKTSQNTVNNKDHPNRHELRELHSSYSEGVLNWRNRYGNRTLARSVVGTSQYMAPEVIRGELYDARCDWWSLAVILYECLYGHTPFLSEEGGRQQTKLNILSHKTTFGFPHKPIVSRRCQDLIRSIIQEKDHRLCSKRYKINDIAPSSQHQDYAGRYVHAHDAEDIKAHKWFKDIQWDRIHLSVPPFVPDIKSMDDTHYFDEEEPISDFSESNSGPSPTYQEISDALRSFNREIQILAKGFISSPHDSIRMRKVEKEIDNFLLCEEQKEYLKAFVKHYGRKEKKRPRDKMLRDRDVASKVLELRKKGAFLGYTYRRFRPRKEVASDMHNFPVGSIHSKRVWHRGRLSIH